MGEQQPFWPELDSYSAVLVRMVDGCGMAKRVAPGTTGSVSASQMVEMGVDGRPKQQQEQALYS